MSEPVLEALRAARAELDRVGNPTPRVDSELLLAHLLGRTRGQLLLAPDLTVDESADFARLISRRAAGEPVQHLTGRAPFRHLELAVGPGVFIPRPETELIVELAESALSRARTAVDLCAGSGAIALAVKHEYPSVQVTAVERSVAALPWLQRNAAAAADPVEVVAADIAEKSLLADRAGQIDVVLSNPPYVPSNIKSELAPEIAYDPDEAVFAGPDGLGLMPALIATAARLLRSGGRFVVEHDESQGQSMPDLLTATGDWREVADHLDLAGRPRFASAVRL